MFWLVVLMLLIVLRVVMRVHIHQFLGIILVVLVGRGGVKGVLFIGVLITAHKQRLMVVVPHTQ